MKTTRSKNNSNLYKPYYDFDRAAYPYPNPTVRIGARPVEKYQHPVYQSLGPGYKPILPPIPLMMHYEQLLYNCFYWKGGKKLSRHEVPCNANVVHHEIMIDYENNSFTVDNKPPRVLDHPDNRPFLESLMRHECPEELEPNNNDEIHLFDSMMEMPTRAPSDIIGGSR